MSETVKGRNIFDIYLSWDRATSVNGRPVNEMESSEAVRASAQEKGVPMDQVPCPYADSRLGKLMNRSALIDMAFSNQNGELLNGLAWLNLKHSPKTTEFPVKRGAALDITNTGVGLVTYLTNKAGTPYSVEGEVPDVIANITKASKGLQAAVATLFVENPEGFMPTGYSLYKYADMKGMLVRMMSSGEEHACAAPQKMFIEAADALYSRAVPNPMGSILEDEIADYNKLRIFGDTFFVSIEESIMFNDVIRQALMSALQFRGDDQRIAIAEDYLRKQGYYLRQCAIRQGEINLILGRDPQSARTPSSDDLQKWLGKDSEVMDRFLESPRDFLISLPR